jgi:hypothetical protein
MKCEREGCEREVIPKVHPRGEPKRFCGRKHQLAERAAKVKADRVAKGLCISCGKRGAKKGRKLCLDCLRKMAASAKMLVAKRIENRLCIRCGEPRTGLHHRLCNTCTPRRAAEHRNYHLGDKYGLSPSEYESMLLGQAGVCAICGNVETVIDKTGNIKRLAVDHCHSTGAVRGLLCMSCNTRMKSSATPELLRRAADYLEKQGTQLRLVAGSG